MERPYFMMVNGALTPILFEPATCNEFPCDGKWLVTCCGVPKTRSGTCTQPA